MEFYLGIHISSDRNFLGHLPLPSQGHFLRFGQLQLGLVCSPFASFDLHLEPEIVLPLGASVLLLSDLSVLDLHYQLVQSDLLERNSHPLAYPTTDEACA